MSEPYHERTVPLAVSHHQAETGDQAGGAGGVVKERDRAIAKPPPKLARIDTLPKPLHAQPSIDPQKCAHHKQHQPIHRQSSCGVRFL